MDDSFFDLGGDSILSMQVVARARAAGCRAGRGTSSSSRPWPGWRGWPVFAEADAGVGDEGVGPVRATPIMRWLQEVDGSDR